MKKLTFALVALFISLLVVSCNVEKVDPDYASKVAGTYAMKTYETYSGGSSTPGPNDKVLVSREDDKHVTITVDYASPYSVDPTWTNISLVKIGETYELSRTFSNAEITGSVTGNLLDFRIDYTDGNWMMLTGEK